MDATFLAELERLGPHADYPHFTLYRAREYCAALTRRHYENFTVGSLFLPRRLIPHFEAVYSYCRWADDLADETAGGREALDLLDWWRGELKRCYSGEVRHPVMVALRETVRRFNIPQEPFLDLISAFERDQRVNRYETFDELLGYCRHSANPVGRLVLHLGESYTELNAGLSDSICTGLQLANFWQDVARDCDNLNRIYIPQEDMRAFGITEADIRENRTTEEFRALMKMQVDRARDYLERGRPLARRLPVRVGFDVELFRQGGLAILRKIEESNWEVLKARPKLSGRDKLAAAAGALWMGTRRECGR